MSTPRIDHTVPPVPLAAGSYYVFTAGGYRFIYPVVALALVSYRFDVPGEWEPVYLHDEEGLRPVGQNELTYMTPEEAASWRKTFDELADLRAEATNEVSDLLAVAGEDGVDYMTVHRILWDARIKEAHEEEEFLNDFVAVRHGSRIYLDTFAPPASPAVSPERQAWNAAQEANR